MFSNILELNGLSVEILSVLSYKSELGISLKKNLHYFDEKSLLNELYKMADSYSCQMLLDNIPIEIQFNTLYDRQLNNWLHDYLYKKPYATSIGKYIREEYENGRIRNIIEFKEVLDNVLSNC